jgi:hypothetical protein
MVGLKMLLKMNEKGAAIWRLPTNCSAVMGGMPVVLTLGDFRQFEPVHDRPLWSTRGGDQDTVARNIWSCFKDVMILTEQMRQRGDVPFQELLSRASNCCLTDEDIDFLNSKTREKMLERREQLPDLAVRPKNAERHDYNRQAIERFAIERGQKIWMFSAEHSRPRKGHVSVGSLLNTGDDGSLKGPGVFFFTPGMPFMLLSNVSTATRLANGKLGTAVDVVLDDTGTYKK